jgi:hypothetical protein
MVPVKTILKSLLYQLSLKFNRIFKFFVPFKPEKDPFRNPRIHESGLNPFSAAFAVIIAFWHIAPFYAIFDPVSEHRHGNNYRDNETMNPSPEEP